MNGEQVSHDSVTGDEARLDIRARGFLRSGQSVFFDTRVTNTNADSTRALSSSQTIDVTIRIRKGNITTKL